METAGFGGRRSVPCTWCITGQVGDQAIRSHCQEEGNMTPDPKLVAGCGYPWLQLSASVVGDLQGDLPEITAFFCHKWDTAALSSRCVRSSSQQNPCWVGSWWLLRRLECGLEGTLSAKGMVGTCWALGGLPNSARVHLLVLQPALSDGVVPTDPMDSSETSMCSQMPWLAAGRTSKLKVRH